MPRRKYMLIKRYKNKRKKSTVFKKTLQALHLSYQMLGSCIIYSII